MRKLVAACSLGLITTVSAAPPPVEAFFTPDRIRNAQLSPDGERLAISTDLGSPRVSLVVMDLRPEGKLSRVAQVQHADIDSFHWVNNERLVFDALDFSGGSGSGRGGRGLFAINADGSQARQLIQRISYFVVEVGQRQRALSSNHGLLRVPRPSAGTTNDEVLIGEYGERGLHGTYWLNIHSGRTRPSGHRLPPRTTRLLTDSSGEPRVAVSREDKRLQAWWRGVSDAEWRPIAEGDTLNGLPFEPHTVDDKGGLYVTQRLGDAGEAVLSRFDFSTGAPEPEALVRTPGFDFLGRLVLEPNGPTGVQLRTDAEQTIWFDADRRRLQDIADARLPGHVNHISCRRCGQPDEIMLVRSNSDREPGALWLYRAKPMAGQTHWRLLMRSRPTLNRAEQASVSFERIRARDGRELPVWLTRPANSENGGPLPTVVLVHGGPWTRGGSWAWRPMQQFLASRGYLVIEPEFRGSTGYGLAHFKAGWKQWGQSMQDDVADALRWAQQEGLASERACIAGASYGGYSTLMGLIKHPDLYRCGIAWVAVTDLELLVKGSWWVDDDSDLARRHTIPEMVGDAERDADMLIANSPVRQAARIKAPLLLAMGEMDIRVPLTHGTRLRDAMTAAGIPPQWVVYPGEGHGWAITRNQLDFAQRVERFLAGNLAPR